MMRRACAIAIALRFCLAAEPQIIPLGSTTGASGPVLNLKACSAFGQGSSRPCSIGTIKAGDSVYAVTFGGNGSACSGFSYVPVLMNNTPSQLGASVARTFNCGAAFLQQNAAAAPPSATWDFTGSSGTYIGYTVIDISGVNASSLDVQPAGFTCDASPCVSPTFSTSSPDEVIVMGCSNYYAATATAGSIGAFSASIPTNGSQNNPNGEGSTGIEYITTSGATQTNITASMNWSGSVSGGGVCFVASFIAP